ncbi:hypothetical protein AQUCO_00700507v1 [Aquilegia coerulea]|uniref:Phytocyanin domain-containing protein n=1 Tax=Aquilegia coerulea TaxID=218851 RepID=A0A2G5EKU0_AQUCA|nr:hypothetical protein AQUCO_00700507v1 [Aquilegia coerulea]
MSSFKVLFFTTLLFSLQVFLVHSLQYEVGEDKGWVIPSAKNDQAYNDWASKHRFQVGDTIHFKYKKDSVLAVTEQEYDKCRSAHPVFFSNNGDTEFKLDRPGLYYFISGVTGHCERGLKMVIKVLDPENLSPPAVQPNSTAPTASSKPHKSAAVQIDGIKAPLVLVLSLFGFLFV